MLTDLLGGTNLTAVVGRGVSSHTFLHLSPGTPHELTLCAVAGPWRAVGPHATEWTCECWGQGDQDRLPALLWPSGWDTWGGPFGTLREGVRLGGEQPPLLPGGGPPEEPWWCDITITPRASHGANAVLSPPVCGRGKGAEVRRAGQGQAAGEWPWVPAEPRLTSPCCCEKRRLALVEGEATAPWSGFQTSRVPLLAGGLRANHLPSLFVSGSVKGAVMTQFVALRGVHTSTVGGA